jgi:hypothetical protein
MTKLSTHFKCQNCRQVLCSLLWRAIRPTTPRSPRKISWVNSSANPDVTAIVLSVTYKKQEFFRVGYYIHNEYVDPLLIENPPDQLQIDKVFRKILAEKPRITRMTIAWQDVAPAVENIPLNGM